jgi:hypothetical protein
MSRAGAFDSRAIGDPPMPGFRFSYRDALHRPASRSDRASRLSGRTTASYPLQSLLADRGMTFPRSRGRFALARCAHQGDARGDVDHHGVPACAARRQSRPCKQDRRQEIHVQHRLDLSLSRDLQPPRANAGGVVDRMSRPPSAASARPNVSVLPSAVPTSAIMLTASPFAPRN